MGTGPAASPEPDFFIMSDTGEESGKKSGAAGKFTGKGASLLDISRWYSILLLITLRR
jgi:hypothetical protein